MQAVGAEDKSAILRRSVFEEYRVIASRIATTLSRKSVRRTAGLYTLKKPWRDWRMDHTKYAAYVVDVSSARVGVFLGSQERQLSHNLSPRRFPLLGLIRSSP